MKLGELVGRVPRPVRRRVPLAMKKLFVLASYPRAIRQRPLLALKYLLFDRETNNFTYDLGNPDDLAAVLGGAVRIPVDTVRRYLSELEHDDELRALLEARLAERRDRNRSAHYGRRLGWYAITRLRHPRLVVESGVHDGLGSAILLRALQRNRMEGSPGELIGLDVDATSGWLIPDELRAGYKLVIDDSLRSLDQLARGSIDLFIHDSDHRYAHEFAEYSAVAPGLAPGGILLSDNAHTCTALKDFSARVGRGFVFWREEPREHFYPGAGIGISLPSGGPGDDA